MLTNTPNRLCATVAAFVIAFGCLSACSSDEVAVPEVPVSYRLTLHTTDPDHPIRTLSATIDWKQSLFSAGMNGKDANAPMVMCGDTWIVPPAHSALTTIRSSTTSVSPPSASDLPTVAVPET